jgi:cytochrome oxidase Cu insertion factor (SCO1/SenC/PrrC family)
MRNFAAMAAGEAAIVAMRARAAIAMIFLYMVITSGETEKNFQSTGQSKKTYPLGAANG